MKKSTLTENKAEQTPTGGVLVGKREGQTIIHNKGTLSGYLVGKTHAEGGIKAVNKSTGQPLEMQGGEVVITAPAVSDNIKNEFNGKMMTNREILSQINVKGGGVAFAKDGMEIPKNIRRTGASYNYGGKTMTDHEIYRHITKRQKQNLVRDAKSGNTPARDLNNYNDVLDMDADGVVGAETGLFDDGGRINKAKYRILNSDGRIKYTGTEMGSWFTLEKAKQIVDYSQGEMIYEYDNNGERLYEVLDDGGAVGLDWDTTFTSGFNKGQKLSEQEIETIDVYDDFVYGLNFKSGGMFDAKTEQTIGLLSITNNPVKLAVILEKEVDGFDYTSITYNQKIKRRLHSLAEKSNRVIVINDSKLRTEIRQFPYLLVSESYAKNYYIASEFYEKLETPRNEFKKQLTKKLEDEKKTKEIPVEPMNEKVNKKEKSFESEGSTEGKGKLYEFFTPQIVADKMLALAQHYGFKGGNVLEPATGSGRLIKNLKNTNITAFEISKDNFEILKREFPNAELYNFNFEKAFLKEPRFNTLLNRKGTETWLKNAPFDLVLANPPYGKFSGLYSSYFNFKGQVEHFFILQTLYLLKKGGLGVYLIPSSFMRNGIAYNEIKKQIFEIAELVDAYRLPSNIFEKTQIGTDILILRKK